MTAERLPRVSVKKGREWQLERGHPWVFSGAISQAPVKSEPGMLVDVVDVNGRFIGSGYYNPNCDIAVRIMTRQQEEALDEEFFRKRVASAVRLRRELVEGSTTSAYRLINAEGDMLPGFIVDSYDGVLVVQSHTAGADRLLNRMLPALADVLAPRAVLLRNDAGVRRREGLELKPAQLLLGEMPVSPTEIRENGISFLVDMAGGQKTGFFTDQRDKRKRFAEYCRQLEPGSTVVNAFAYTGAFGVYAALSNRAIETVNIDSSQAAIELARLNFTLNGIDESIHRMLTADVFEWLQQEQGHCQYEAVVLDPPAFAKSHKETARALKAYARLFRLGISLVKPGGLILLCSCSGSVTFGDFEECLREAAGAARRCLQLLETFRNGLDHPVNVAVPESSYLKVAFCRVL